MTTFIHAYRCKVCGNRFELKRKTETPPKNPTCPRVECRGTHRVRESHMPDVGLDVSAGIAPSIGGSIPTRAMDEAMKITAEDHHLTDLNTSAHYGESMAPKLPPRLQAQADGFFGGGRVKTGGRRQIKVDLRGALGALSQGGAPAPTEQGGGGFAVDVRNLLPAGQRGQSAVPSHRVIAGDRA